MTLKVCDTAEMWGELRNTQKLNTLCNNTIIVNTGDWDDNNLLVILWKKCLGVGIGNEMKTRARGLNYM